MAMISRRVFVTATAASVVTPNIARGKVSGSRYGLSTALRSPARWRRTRLFVALF
jgi:hypothetical protein